MAKAKVNRTKNGHETPPRHKRDSCHPEKLLCACNTMATDENEQVFFFSKDLSSSPTFHKYYPISSFYSTFYPSHFDQPPSLSCPAPHFDGYFCLQSSQL